MASNTSNISESTPVRRGGKAISDEIRSRLIKAHETGLSYGQISELYDVKKDTVYRICSFRQYTTKPRGGSKGRKINQETLGYLINLIESRADITLHEMKDALIQEKGLTVSVATIARCLEGSLITLKKMELVPMNRNSEENKIARRQHASWLQTQYELGAQFCYIDECGFGLYTARSHGRSVRGLPARRIVPNQRTPHITMLCAISPNAGLIHKMMITGGAKQENFDQFINELFHLEFGQAVNPIEGVNKCYLIFDNAPCHRGIEARLAENIPENFELIRLPPYSCELNPIEFSFNSLKAYLKRAISIHGPIIPNHGQSLATARRQFLLQLAPSALSRITATSTLNSFFHVLTITAPKAIRLEDL